MNTITASFIILVCAVALLYLILKNSSINSLTKNMKVKDYPTVLINAQKPFTRKMLGNFNCDLFMMRAYYLLHDMEHLKIKALEMLSQEYRSDQKKTFLELYYHIFLNQHDLDMSNQFLNEIVKIDDHAFVTYNQYAYNVLIEKESDLIDVMEAEISAKMYEGFALGTVVYLIAMQYLYLGNQENAELYFNECLTCFHPNAFYVELAKSHIKELEKKA